MIIQPKRNRFSAIFSVLVVALLFVGITFLFRNNDKRKISRINSLVVQHSYLLKTKLALIEYLRIEENDPDYEILKTQIEDRLKSSNKEGLNHFQNLKDQDIEPQIFSETEDIYTDQKNILEQNDQEIIDHLVELSDLLRRYLLLIQEAQK